MKLNTAILLSVIVHLGLMALLISNFQWSKPEIKQSGTPQPKINATAVNSKRVEQLVKKLKNERLTKKRQEQKRLDDLKKAEDDAKRRRIAEEKKAEEARKSRAQAEQRRKAEEKKAADLKKKREKEEVERKKKAEAEKRRKEEAERKRKADAEKRRKEEAERKRKAKEEAERKRKEAEEKARQEALEREMEAQMAAEAAELAAAHKQMVMSEVDKYVALIKGKITRNWIEPEKMGYCIFRISMAPGGLILSVSAVEGDPQHCDSGQRAIYKSEPLPVSNDPDVFAELKSIRLTLDNRSEEEQ